METHNNIDHRTSTLDEILTHSWTMLQAGAKRSKHPFHTAVIGTIAEFNCNMRTVVLRRVSISQRLLICHSDRRSAKIAELKGKGRLSWLFYDREEKIQIRAEGKSLLHVDDVLADEQWSRTSTMSRRCYCGEDAPGQIMPSRTSGLPQAYEERSPTLLESEAGRKHFVVISCQLDTLDWLHLHARGHSRARFSWIGKEFKADWIVP